MNHAFVPRLNFCPFIQWWWIRFCSYSNQSSWSWGSCRCGLTRQPNMPQPLHCPVQPLQPKGLTIKEQNRIILLVILTDTFKAHFGLPMLVIVKFHCNSVVLVLMEWPGLVLINWSWFKFIWENTQVRTLSFQTLSIYKVIIKRVRAIDKRCIICIIYINQITSLQSNSGRVQLRCSVTKNIISNNSKNPKFYSFSFSTTKQIQKKKKHQFHDKTTIYLHLNIK